MNLTITTENGETLATLEGRLDTINAPEFEKQMQPLLQPDVTTIVMDCAALEYIASSGLRLLLSLQKNVMARKGKLTLKNMRPEVKSVFDMTGFTKIFSIQ